MVDIYDRHFLKNFFKSSKVQPDFDPNLPKKWNDDLEKWMSPFKKWEIITDVKKELIWIFSSIGHHWLPNDKLLWKYIFAQFKKAISKQWREDWQALGACWDDDLYLDSRFENLWNYYRHATDDEKLLFFKVMKEQWFELSDDELDYLHRFELIRDMDSAVKSRKLDIIEKTWNELKDVL